MTKKLRHRKVDESKRLNDCFFFLSLFGWLFSNFLSYIRIDPKSVSINSAMAIGMNSIIFSSIYHVSFPSSVHQSIFPWNLRSFFCPSIPFSVLSSVHSSTRVWAQFKPNRVETEKRLAEQRNLSQSSQGI